MKLISRKLFAIIAVIGLTPAVFAVDGDATWKKVTGVGTGGTNWAKWSDTTNWEGGEAPGGTAARAYMNAGYGQYIELPSALMMWLITSGATTLEKLPVLRGDGVLKLYCSGVNASSIQGIMLYSPFKLLCESDYTGLSMTEAHICAPCAGLSKLDDTTASSSLPRFARNTYFHYDRFATALSTDGSRTVNDWPTSFNFDAEGTSQMRIYSPVGSDTDLTSNWVQTEDSPFFKQVTGATAHTLSVGTRVTGEGIPADTYLKRVFPDGTIELSAAATSSIASNPLTFAKITYNTVVDYSTRKLMLFNQGGDRNLYVQKLRDEDELTVYFKNIDLYVVDKLTGSTLVKSANLTLRADEVYKPGLFKFDQITSSRSDGQNLKLSLMNSHLMPPKNAARPFYVWQDYVAHSVRITVNEGEIRPLTTSTYPMSLQSLKGTVTKDGAGTWTLVTTNTAANAYSGSLIVKKGAVQFLKSTAPIVNLTIKAGAKLIVNGELEITNLTAEAGAIVSGGGIRGNFSDATLANIEFEDGGYAIPTTPATEVEADITAIKGGVSRLSYQGDAIFMIATNSTIKIAKAGTYDMLVVGGGGGAGNMWGGGGGGGGVIYKQSVYLTNGVYSVVVGLGGLGAIGRGGSDAAITTARWNSSGGYSYFAGVKALGGGAGGTYLGNETKDYREGIQSYKGVTGASGGGGGMMYPQGKRNSPGAAGTAGQGNRGADGFNYYPSATVSEARIAGGGGGGAGSAAVNAYTNEFGQTVGSNGGDGVMVSIFGEKWYGGGGGGGARESYGVACTGGKGGGGNGAVSTSTKNGSDGMDGTGGGGGGATAINRDSKGLEIGIGGNGGSGVVILRCAQTDPETKPMPRAPIATGGTLSRRGNYAIHRFSADGNFVINSDSYVDVLVVGGGGGGGLAGGGGGGGGAVLVYTNVWLKAGTYPVTIGKGGVGAIAYDKTPHQYSYNGGDTILEIGGSALAKITAPGGGGGGTRVDYTDNADPKVGASGGGAGAPYYGTTTMFGLGADGIDGYGFGGGSSTNCGTAVDHFYHYWSSAGGGGGGAGGAGSNGWYTGQPSSVNRGHGGVGGMGVACDFSGRLCYYGVGGSGGSSLIVTDSSGYQDNAQSGGARGGGVIDNKGQRGENGVNGGGGGGSGVQVDNYMQGGNGGDGLVLIRYRCAPCGLIIIYQ